MSGLIFRIFVLLSVFAFSAGVSASQSLGTQTDSQSGVTIKVTPKSLKGAIWEFAVVFDTHTKELNDDLLKSAILVDAAGAQISPIDWKGDPPGGHHREGVLRFNAPTAAAAEFELRVTRSGEPKPRSFRWTPK